MATVVKMPKWGLTMTVGTVTDWLIAEGAEVSEGDPLFTVETEKAVNDVEAPIDGVVVKIVATTGDEVPVSGAVAVMAAAGESLSEDEIAALVQSLAPSGPVARPSDAAASGTGRAATRASRDEGGRVNASPAARRRAQELGMELATVAATGPDGRITSEDVERAAAEASLDPTPREERITLADGRELNVLLAGSGDGAPLLFVHGLGGSQSTWQVVLGDLVGNHRTASIDLPGHGASDKSASADYSANGLVSAVAEAIELLGMQKPVIVGHSLGGAVALKIAAQHPESVAGVVAIDSAGLGADISGHLTDLMKGQPGPDVARGLLELFYEDQKLVVDRGVQEMAQTQLGEGAWAAQQAASQSAFAGDRQLEAIQVDLQRVKPPVLLIWGEKDRVLPVDHAISAVGSLPDAMVAIVAGVGHVPQIENSSRTAQLIGRFARSLN